jgi:hypothetical protein
LQKFPLGRQLGALLARARERGDDFATSRVSSARATGITVAAYSSKSAFAALSWARRVVAECTREKPATLGIAFADGLSEPDVSVARAALVSAAAAAAFTLPTFKTVDAAPSLRALTLVGQETNPEIDGVLPDAAVRADLRARFGKVISDGMGHLRRAAEIDPQYSSALVTLNSLLREYASLSDTAGECRRLEAEADRWGEQGLAAQRQASGNGRTSSGAAPQPPPPPPPPPHPVQAGAAPRRMLKISPDSVTRDW